MPTALRHNQPSSLTATYSPGALIAASLASTPALVLLVVVLSNILLGNLSLLDHDFTVVLHLTVLHVANVLLLWVYPGFAKESKQILEYGVSH